MRKKDADGILFTENTIFNNEIGDVEHPKVLTAQNIRAAQIYNIAFTYVRENFAIAGLLSHIQVKYQNFQFCDGDIVI